MDTSVGILIAQVAIAAGTLVTYFKKYIAIESYLG
jgi:hypothetical protein